MGKRVFILGAGASHSYDRSVFGVRPPLARGFFKAYHELPISEDFSVKVGNIVNYVRDHYGIPPHEFYDFTEDVESFLVRLDEHVDRLKRKATRRRSRLRDEDFGQLWEAQRAKFELLVLFSRVFIDTTDGPSCPYLGLFAANLSPEDVIISFNWDTLVDRALHSSGKWFPDDGYGVTFEAIMDGEWRLPAPNVRSAVRLFKLHGSINWLIAYPGLDPGTGQEVSVLPPDRYHDKFCFMSLEGHPLLGCREVLINPLTPPQRQDGKATIAGNVVIDPKTGRYKVDLRTYSDYTPHAKLTSLIIPPTHHKTYDLPGQVFEQLWPQALKSLVDSDEVYICGYSLPDTDDRPRDLLREAAKSRGRPWRIGLVTPNPELLSEKIGELTRGCDVGVWHAAPSFERFVAPNTHDLVIPGPATI